MYEADLALVNAKIITMDPARPRAEAALVRRGRIELVGASAEVLGAAGGSPVFDAGGRTVVPGFIDGHNHFEMTCASLVYSLPAHTPPHASLAAIADALRAEDARLAPGKWLIARSSFGLQYKVAEGRLFTREELDAVSTTRPIVVFAGLHVAMLNTPALEGIDVVVPGHEPRGAYVHRNAAGRPTGVATEIWPRMPAFTYDEMRAGFRAKARELFVANGVTSVYSIPYTGDEVRAEQDAQAAGELPIRLRSYYHVPDRVAIDSIVALGQRPGFGSDMMRFGGVKIFVDGEHGDGLGNVMDDFKWTQEELDAFVARAEDAAIPLWMHAVSGEAVRMAARSVQRVTGGKNRLRHRIEHGADYLDPKDALDLHRQGVLLVTTPQFLYSASEGGGEYTPLRTVIDAGFEPIGASDSTGTVPDGIAPLFNIAMAVTRRTRSGDVVSPAERITAEEGLKMFTTWAAVGGHEERDKGSIEPGKFGDFAVLSHDPLAIDPEKLFDVAVEATILGGEVVYER